MPVCARLRLAALTPSAFIWVHLRLKTLPPLQGLENHFGRFTQGGARCASLPCAIIFHPVGALIGDQLLARHYGFTEEELDFILNYDIKYRLGRDSGQEEGEE